MPYVIAKFSGVTIENTYRNFTKRNYIEIIFASVSMECSSTLFKTFLIVCLTYILFINLIILLNFRQNKMSISYDII
jgi:hypothetical protein